MTLLTVNGLFLSHNNESVRGNFNNAFLICLLDCVHTIPEQFENGRNLDRKNLLQHFNAKEAYLHPKGRSVLFRKCLRMFCFHHFQVFTRCYFQNVSVRAQLSKSTVFKICWQKMCRFRVNGRPIPSNFSLFSKCAGIVWMQSYSMKCAYFFDFVMVLRLEAGIILWCYANRTSRVSGF